MEKYKKKSLKFMGYSRELRKNQLDNQRCVSRLERFSVCRNDDSNTEEKIVNQCRIPTKGKPIDNRTELLQKWKQEKMMKKQQESKLKKPVFKVGVTKPSPSPSIGSRPLFALDTSSRVFKSSFKVSNSQLFGKKQESFVASNSKASLKVPNSQPSIKNPSVATGNLRTNAKVPTYQSVIKKPDLSTDKSKTNAKDLKIQPLKSKIGMASKPDPQQNKNKESNIKSLSVKPKADTLAKVVPKESRLQPLNARSKTPSAVKAVKSNIPSSGLPKPAIYKTLSKNSNQIPSSGLPKPSISKALGKDSDQNHIPKSSASKNHEVKSIDRHNPEKNSLKGSSKITMRIPSQQKGFTTDKASLSESETPKEPVDEFPAFEWELSRIEPIVKKKESFAPEGFKFQPPVELSNFLLSDDGPSAIFLKIKNEYHRTSTPYRNSSSRSLERSDLESPVNEATKDIKNENVEFLKDENIECSKNTDRELEHVTKPDLETLLSSPLGSVSLNDLKTESCIQTPKSELPEVVPTQNQEASLSSKEIHTEQSSVTEPPPILPIPVETGKNDVNSINIDTIGVNAQSVSPALEENDKIEINAIEIEESKISVHSPGVDSVFVADDEMPIENAKKNQPVSNGFIQHLENGAFKMPLKPRNLLQSEKPGLVSISESLENTPKSGQKKVLDSVFTPRRSLRLAKVLGNFSGSLDDLHDSPKTKDQDKTDSKGNLTPRRSKRLSKFSTEFNSVENLFDVRRPTLFNTPEEDKPVKKIYSKVTYDFDRLSIESEEETRPFRCHGKPSLLPISRPSVRRYSVKEDLMSFSPDV